MNLSLDKKQFNHLFPFYVQIDRELNIISFGDSLTKIAPAADVKKIQELFNVKKPEALNWNFESLKALIGTAIIFECIEHPNTTLRGEMLATDDDTLFFIGTPWLASVEELKLHQLQLSDFSLHNPMIDLLHLLEAQEIANNKTKELFETVTSQRNELKLLSMIARETVNAVIITDVEGKMEWVNKGFETMTGYQLHEVKGKKPSNILQGKDTQEEAVEYMRVQLRKKEPFVVEARRR